MITDQQWYITHQGTIGLKENAISGPFNSTEDAFKSLLPKPPPVLGDIQHAQNVLGKRKGYKE